MNNSIESATKFIEKLDSKFGQGWTDTTDEIAKQLVNYANLVNVKKQRKEKLKKIQSL